MSKHFLAASLGLLLLTLAGCDKADAPPPVKIFTEERRALDKAKTVEGTLQAGDENARKKLDEATK